MILEKIALVVQGQTLSRIGTEQNNETIRLSVYAMSEMNLSVGEQMRAEDAGGRTVSVSKDAAERLLLTTEGMVLIHLTTQRAAVVLREHEGMVVPSNFVAVQCHQGLEPYFFEWYFNEHPECRRYLAVSVQGTLVGALSIQMLRTLDVSVPTIRKQQVIARIRETGFRKTRLMYERTKLERLLLNESIRNYMSIGEEPK